MLSFEILKNLFILHYASKHKIINQFDLNRQKILTVFYLIRIYYI